MKIITKKMLPTIATCLFGAIFCAGLWAQEKKNMGEEGEVHSIQQTHQRNSPSPREEQKKPESAQQAVQAALQAMEELTAAILADILANQDDSRDLGPSQ